MTDDEKRDVIQDWIRAGSPTCSTPTHPLGVTRVVLPGQSCPHCSKRFKLDGGR